ncbi:MAG: NADH-quinone oxidoreductase subunit M [Gemmatimonadaceae bacterium]|nr:NADH-quinone oxidoreductase subunit M [Gemmatimonadaceae bacterium]
MQDFLVQINYNAWILPALLLIPLAGALVLLVTGSLSSDDGTLEGAPSARMVALLVFVLEFVVSMGLWWSYDPAGSRWQATYDHWWIIPWNARLSLGIDGISLMMVLLTTVIMPLAVLGSWTSIRSKVRSYYALLMVLTTGMLGVFVSRDMLLFYVMWEIMLVPMYFIIGIWGGERRIYASLKFFVYTMAGSLLMLVGILYLWNASSVGGSPATFDYDQLLTIAHTHKAALWLFGAFFLAFAVKVPMFPFHTWLPDAHVEAPTAGSVILAAIMLKMGTYGFLRFAMPLFPSAAMTPWVRTTILTLAVIGIIYGALVAMVQPDFKKLVAYSSVSHLGFVMLGIFALTLQSVQGALMVMISHGISTGALFLLIGMIYERRHTRLIEAYGGIARVVPLFSTLLVIVSLSSIGLPSTNGFVGEFLVLIGSFRTHPFFAFFATTGVIFAAAYLLWAIQRILFNALDKPENEHITDLNARELTMMGVLVAAIFWIGIYPQPILRRMEPSAALFVRTVTTGQANVRTAARGDR